MRRKWVFYVVFFTVLVVGFYFTLAHIIPGYADKKFPSLNYVQPFSFTNQDGQQVTQQDVLGKVHVVEYFFTTCPSICPKMNTNMRKIYEAYKDEPDFMILSHTCDPDNDHPARLKQYSDSLQVDTRKWVFLTGRKDSLYSAARVSYLLDDPKNNAQNINEQFLHTQFFALVDKNGNVRKKIYDGLHKDEILELEKDIAVLLKEPAHKRFVNNVFSK